MDGHVEVDRVLLNGGADVRAQVKHGRRSSRDRCRCKWLGKVWAEPVVSCGVFGRLWRSLACSSRPAADTSAQDNNGQSPLHQASFKGRVKVVCVLLEGSADVSARDKHGQSPVHRAVFEGHLHTSRKQ